MAVKASVNNQNQTTVRVGQQNAIRVNSTSAEISSADTATTAVNVVGGRADVTQLVVSGLSTFTGIVTTASDLYVGGDLYLTDDLVLDNITGNSLDISGISSVGFLTATDVWVSGVVTATSFYGDGTNLTGIAKTGADATFNNLKVTGIATFKGTVHALDKVGIGTTNPEVALEIKGTDATLLRLDSSHSTGTSLRIRNNGTDKMYMGLAGDFITGQTNNVTDSAIRASGALLFSSGGGDERLRILSDGKVGIGITNPTRMLHLHEFSGIEATIHFSTSATGTTASDGFRVGMNASEEAVVWNNESGIIKFGTSNDERLRITSGGVVNIGDNFTQTTYPFSVQKDLGSGGNLAYFANSDGDYNQGLTLSFDSDKDVKWEGGSAIGGLIWDMGTRGYVWQIGGSEKLRIDSSGNVGIGSEDPKAKLDVDGTLSVSGLSTYIGIATYKDDVFIDGTLTAGAIDGGTY